MAFGILSPAEAADIIRRLAPGETVTYYMGDMGSDRAERSGRVSTERALAVSALADFMQANCRIGEIVGHNGNTIRCWGGGLLSQRKVTDGVYTYLFTKSKGG